MKNFTLVILFLFICNFSQGQTLTEKKIYEGKDIDAYSLWDFKYDAKTGSYAYTKYDTITQKTKLISNKGNSADYNYINSMSLLFDNSGNYYATASNGVDGTPGTYYMLKNGKEIKSFEFINDAISMKGDALYFIAREKNKDCLAKYSLTTGEIEYGQKYDTINFSFIKDMPYYEGEPGYELGFTKDGRPYYQACAEGKQMIVVGTSEMKKYDEVQFYNVYPDKNGDICYVAKNIVNGKNEYCLVQGEKEYKKFTSVNTPIVFDAANVPVYSASDLPEEYPSEQFVVRGSEIISSRFSKGIYDILITPSGKIAFNGSDTLADGTFINVLVIDGKEIARYSSIYDIKFRSSESPVFIASDKNNSTFVVDGNKIVSDKYGYIYDLEIRKNGTLSYTGVNYGDYDKQLPDKFYYILGKKKYGPITDLIMAERITDQVVFNENDEYMYAATDSKPGNYENVKYFAKTEDWKSDKYDIVQDLCSYKSDFYFTASNYLENGSSTQQLFKNDDKVGKEYAMIMNLKLDKDKGVITFIASRKDKVYLVEVKL
jgi:hypothetical protein